LPFFLRNFWRGGAYAFMKVGLLKAARGAGARVHRRPHTFLRSGYPMFKRFVFIAILFVLAVSMAGCGIIQFQVGPINMIRGSGNVINETRPVSGFDRVQLTSSGDAVIVMGETEDVVVEAEDNIVPLVETNVVNGKLVIGMKPNTSISTSRGMRFTIHVKKLTGLELNGSGNARIDTLTTESFSATLTGSGDAQIGKIEGSDLNFTLNGSGDLTVDQLQGAALHLRSTGSGNTRIAGQAADLDVSLNGSGNFEGADLKAQNASVTTTGSGNASVWVELKLDARTSGSGNVRYYGLPAVNQTASGSGRVRGMGNK
jgi:hypothetical protein